MPKAGSKGRPVRHAFGESRQRFARMADESLARQQGFPTPTSCREAGNTGRLLTARIDQLSAWTMKAVFFDWLASTSGTPRAASRYIPIEQLLATAGDGVRIE